MKQIVGIIILAIVFQCCSHEPGSRSEIEKEKLIPLLVDIHLTDAYLQHRGFRPNKQTQRDKIDNAYGYILEKHNVTPNQFLNTMQYYGQHTKEYEAIYNKVIEILSKYETECMTKPDDKSTNIKEKPRRDKNDNM